MSAIYLEINQDSHARMLYEAREKQRKDSMGMERRARMEGIEIGMEKGANKLAELIKMGFSVEDALRKVKEDKMP